MTFKCPRGGAENHLYFFLPVSLRRLGNIHFNCPAYISTCLGMPQLPYKTVQHDALKHHNLSTLLDIALTYFAVVTVMIVVYPLLNQRLLRGSGQRLVCRIPCSGQAQCTSRRDIFLLLFPPQPIEHFMASARARTTAEGWGMGARYVVRRHATTQTVFNKEI
jgi:hypothetical protein